MNNNTHQSSIPYWVATCCVDLIGPRTFHKLLKHFKNIKTIFHASAQELLQLNLKPEQIENLKNINWQKIENEITWCEKNNVHLITWDDPLYPSQLKEIIAAPLILFAQGNINLLTTNQIAIVGSRNPSTAGKELAFNFGQALARAGLTITSGLALGIDAMSHRGTLKAKGDTIAVMGTGLKNIYPASHQKLATEIRDTGLLLSEFTHDTLPQAKNFPLRNRLISGLSNGVLVVEAALKSGSLITARFALEQNREVFAIPGSIHNPLSKGTHYLIQQGAKLVTQVTDILEELGYSAPPQEQKLASKSPALESKHLKVLEKIDYHVTSFDSILARSGLTTGEVSSILLVLELGGFITTVSQGYLRNS